MKVYIAAPYELITNARELRDQLFHHNIGCTSRWLDGNTGSEAESASVDLQDVRSADALVLLNPKTFERSGTGGRHVETGYALAFDRPVFVVGIKSNIFHDLTRVLTSDELLPALKLLRTALQRGVVNVPRELGVTTRSSECIDHPAHYGGADNVYEAIRVIEAWKLGFCLGNVVKYISRAGKKGTETHIEDLRKAAWYLNREIEQLTQQTKSTHLSTGARNVDDDRSR